MTPNLTITLPGIDPAATSRHLLSISDPGPKPLAALAADFAWANGRFRATDGLDINVRRVFRTAFDALLEAVTLESHGSYRGYEVAATLGGTLYFCLPDGSQSMRP